MSGREAFCYYEGRARFRRTHYLRVHLKISDDELCVDEL